MIPIPDSKRMIKVFIKSSHRFSGGLVCKKTLELLIGLYPTFYFQEEFKTTSRQIRSVNHKELSVKVYAIYKKG